MKIYVSAKDIIKRYGIRYPRINYLTKKDVFRIIKRKGNKRLYSLEEIDKKIKG